MLTYLRPPITIIKKLEHESVMKTFVESMKVLQTKEILPVYIHVNFVNVSVKNLYPYIHT